MCQSTPSCQVEKSRLKKQSENSRKISPEPTFKEHRLAKFSRHVFVCTNFREPGSARPSCTTDGKSELHTSLKDAVKAAGLVPGIRVNKSGCLEQCDEVFEDVPEIVSEHLIAGCPVERLRIADDCLNAAVCPHRPALANRA